MSTELNQINIIQEFIDIDTSNQEIAKNSIIKLSNIVKEQFIQPYDPNRITIHIMLLLGEIIKEVELLSSLNKQLLGKDKKQIAIHLGFLIIKEFFSNTPDIFKSYVAIYKDNVEPFLETILDVSQVVNSGKGITIMSIPEINEFFDIDTSNQEIAKISIVNIINIVKEQFNTQFDSSKIYIQVMVLLSEIIKEVERLSSVNKQLSGKDKKQIAINLGYLALKEFYANTPDIFKSYMNVYKENVEPFLELMLGVSKVVNVNLNTNKKSLLELLCPCLLSSQQ